jgi:N-acetylneuraminate synthase
MERLCKESKDAWIALGSSDYKQKNAEEKSKIFRRSIYFVREIPAGSVITKNDIRRIRPGMGLAPKFFNALIGKKLKKDVDIGIATTFELFEDV